MQTDIPTAAAPAVPEMIRLAHARSAAFGLRASESADLHPVQAGVFSEVLERNRTLCTHALPVMETLYGQIMGTQSMVLLTDAAGTILHALGDDDFLPRADRVALRPGVGWSEQSKGTNAIGTALACGAPLQVHAGQHYLRANHFLTCSCAPILDPQGRIIGALDVSGDHRSQSKHTVALVRMSVQMVENHLLGKLFEGAVRLRFHARAEFLGTLMEGMAAFTPDGRFLSANRSGQFQLGMGLPALQAHTFSSLFGLDMGALLAHCRQAAVGALVLQLPGGVKVVAQAEFRPRAGMALPLAEPMGTPMDVPAARPAVAPPRPAGLSGLRYLQTGDAQLAQALDRVAKVLGRDVATLILGETGTGKELLARAIHHDSPRRAGPFVAVNCASIPETLIESELFGYEDGAFTGARRRGSVGRIAQAHGGTLFLDEIGDMPLAMQARLLRVLQERSVAPLGGARQIDVDVAVVCATHRNLREMMAAGSFREDLYYRLNGLVVRLPPLRERTDLPVIVERLLRAQDGQGAQPAARVAPEVMALFQAHPWPGNLRQLANVLRIAALLAEGAPAIGREHLPEDFWDSQAPAPSMPAPVAAAPARLRQVRGDAFDEALARHGGNVSQAARALGVSRNTVYRHLRAKPPVG
ncbi:sigma-54-dependent Fis family transcriptional regulator [Ramlibacter sp. H39-3-26]|uniref:sigma-54-dependent Fis family transcriptional regulator n=1 Tax=Curvibacter soli TaxID=3031331 RepID=UPI0023DAE495|nr:sigma-54-dependent Fis family transcriptional regulator [Ramlibacter sp. H39-3-26]MDF1485276.1 sigma-54-dependent Fis family transcriptional regulator [Ramlibacter sp. H39-3-26]